MIEHAGKKSFLIYPENLLEIIGDGLDKRMAVLMIMLLNVDENSIVKSNKVNRIISKTLSVDNNYVSKIIMDLHKEGFLEKIGRGKYMINPYLFANRNKVGIERYHYNELLEEENYDHVPISREEKKYWLVEN